MAGSIVKRNKKYSFVYYAYDLEGNKIQKWVSGFNTKEEAKNYKKSYNEKINPAIASGPHIKLDKYLYNWLNTYCERKGLAENTIKGYKVNISHICNSIGNYYLDEINASVLDILFEDLKKKGLGGTSQLYVYRVLHKAFETAVKRREIPFNYCDLIEPPKKDKNENKCIVGNDMSKYISYLLSIDIKYSLPILISLCMGLRRGEVLGLSWFDVNYKDNTIEIKRTATPGNGGYIFSDCKTMKSKRTLVIPEIICTLLHKWYDVQSSFSIDNPEQFIFMQENNKILCASTLNRHFKNSLKECGMDEIRFHDLRHSFATFLISNSVPPNAVSNILGHSKVSTTLDIYTHEDFSLQKIAFDCINNVVSTSKN